jgi:hypothetical protein
MLRSLYIFKERRDELKILRVYQGKLLHMHADAQWQKLKHRWTSDQPVAEGNST